MFHTGARALANFPLRQQKSCSLLWLVPSRGNRTVADNDTTHMFQSVRAQWQLNSCLLGAVRCSKVHKPCVLRHTAMSFVEDVQKLIWEVERRPPLCVKNK